MTNKEAILYLKEVQSHIDLEMGGYTQEMYDAIDMAIGALERDSKVDHITFHWNDEKNNFVAACNAFEDILEVYGRGVSE